MIKCMEVLKAMYRELDSVTKKLFYIYIIIIAFTCLIITVIEIWYKQLFPDYTTALYWIHQFVLLGDGITKAMIIPSLLYEIILKYNRG